MTGLSPYPAMKDSGVPWLGEVPEHWEVVRLRNTSEMRVSNVDKHAKDDEQPVRLCNYVDVYKNDRIRSRMAFMRATATTDEIERFRLQSGDVLITKDSEAWNDIGVPALVEDTQDDIVSGYHLALLRPFPERVDGGYLFRALQSPAVAYQFHVEANGVTRYGLSHSAIKSVWLPLPPLPEQTAIVRYLNYADRRIRRYIRAKQKLIKLLAEKREAATHNALRLAGSHSLRVGSAADRVERLIIRQDDQVYTPIGLYNRGRGIFHKPATGGSDLGDSTFFWLAEGDLVLSGQFAWEGAVALAGEEDDGCVASHRYPVLCGKPDLVESAYLLSFFRTGWGQLLLDHHSRGAAGRNRPLNVASLMKERVPVPSLHVQKQIGTLVRREYRLRQALAEQATLLHEYRTRLIADVVTGKLDVREAAAGLPDEVEEPEPFDETSALIDGEEEPSDNLDAVTEEAEV